MTDRPPPRDSRSGEGEAPRGSAPGSSPSRPTLPESGLSESGPFERTSSEPGSPEPGSSASPGRRSPSGGDTGGSVPPGGSVAPFTSDAESPWPRRIKAGLKWTGIGVAAAVVAGVISVVAVIQHYSKGLPDVDQIEATYRPPQVTRILARDGTLLANMFVERRTVVPFEKVPPHVIHAFLAAEDAHFFEHEGLNYIGMLRAMVVNLRAGQVRQGGSTITQQVVKNILLDSERSYRRKIRETILAHRLEKHLSKEQILGLYMNHIYLGHGRWGVEEAARYYFGKHVSDLDIAEGALLAGIVASPERYSPRRDEDKALKRRRYVLDQMLAKGFIGPPVYEEMVDEPLRLAPAVEAESDLVPEIVPHVKKLLREVAGEAAARGGFTVHTTIDPLAQAAARKAVREGLDDYWKRQKLSPPFTLEKRRLWGSVFEGAPKQHRIYVGKVVDMSDDRGTIDVLVGKTLGRVNLRKEERFNPNHLPPSKYVSDGAALRVRMIDDPRDADEGEPVRLTLDLAPEAALVALDVGTREVRALVGSYEALAGSLDRTVQAKRQPGSSFKPLMYSYALHSRRFTPQSRFEFDRPPNDEERDPDTVDEAEGDTEAEPTKEVLSLRRGVATSDNRVARETLRLVGAQNVVDWAHALGLQSKLGADESLALGSYEVTPLELANAYATLASGGEVDTPVFVTRIEGPNGDVELPKPPPRRRVVSPDVAYLTTSLLESVVQEGTAQRAKRLKRPVAGKTGTTNKNKDAWFAGYSTEMVAVTYVGYDDALPLGWGEAGAVSALPIWVDFMEAIHEGKPVTQFPRPAGIVEVKIDPATGLLARFDQEDAVTEVFLEGTEPTEVAPEPREDEESPDEVPRGHGRPASLPDDLEVPPSPPPPPPVSPAAVDEPPLF